MKILIKKNYIKYIVIFIILFTILYTVLWFLIANQVKNNIYLSKNSLFYKNGFIHDSISVNGYPFKFIICMPQQIIKIGHKTKISFKDMIISSNIFNYKVMKVISKELNIFTYINENPITFKSQNYQSIIRIDHKKNLYKQNHSINNSKVLIKSNKKEINLSIKKINLLTAKENNNLDLRILFNSISSYNYNDISTDSIYIDLSLNNLNSFRVSEGYFEVLREDAKINLNNFYFKNKLFNFSANGLLNIDKEFNLNGKLNFTSYDPMIFIYYLYENKFINITQYKAIKLIYSISKDIHRNKIDMPIYLKSSKIFIGPIFIYAMPPINELLF